MNQENTNNPRGTIFKCMQQFLVYADDDAVLSRNNKEYEEEYMCVLL